MKLITLGVLAYNLFHQFECGVFEQIQIDHEGGNVVMMIKDLTEGHKPLFMEFNTREIATLNKDKYYQTTVNCSRSVLNICRKYQHKLFLNVNQLNGKCQTVNYTSNVGGNVKVSIKLKNLYLYGGAEHVASEWPIDKIFYKQNSYVTKVDYYQAILEPFWLTSNGYSIYVHESIPLFISLNPHKRIFELSAENTDPYLKHDGPTHLNFTLCKFENAKLAHINAINEYLGKPVSLPDVGRVKEPIWSTWVRYKDNINEDVVIKYAEEIHEHGFTGQVEIDDHWEACYGSLSPDLKKFPNMKNLTTRIQILNFRVAIWVHPFVNEDCNPTHAFGVEKEYFVRNIENQTTMRWWRGSASYIDFTNPEASKWYRKRLMRLMDTHGIDALKFDGGESSFSPAPSKFYNTDYSYPETIMKDYVKIIASLGRNVHTRVARGTQKYPIFVTMMDRDSRWGKPLGLSTLISQLLQMNVIGYSFVLPDMIGGNFYGSQANSELFIRWLQANVFMPSMQFSVPPWDYGKEVIEITKKFVNLHAKYADYIIELMKRNVESGDPVNPPLWWIAPDDPEAQICDSEFLLGEDVLVAPVLVEGATHRDVYIPEGCWKDGNTNQLVRGPTWLRKYPADLSVLPYFTRVEKSQRHSNGIINTRNCAMETSVFDFLAVSEIFLCSITVMMFLFARCLWIRRRVFKYYRGL